MTEELRQLPLAEVHREAGARFGAFAGWSMPLTYPAGVMQEHQHTRAHAGLFDISHMKLVEISGADAQRLLAHASPLEPDALRQGQGKYSFLLNDEAGILDDIIVTRLGPDRYMVVVNAGNADADIAHYRRLAAGLDVRIDPLERVFLALQGPDAAGVLAKAGLDGSGLGFMTASEPRPGWFLSRSGYTGEDGFEIFVANEGAVAVWDGLLEVGQPHGLVPAGLGARDTLRLEAALRLYGNDIDESTNPFEAGLGWTVKLDAGDFIGKDALARIKAEGPTRKLVGIEMIGKGIARHGYPVLSGGEPVGQVTSGSPCPTLEKNLGLAYVPASLARVGERVDIQIRDKAIEARIVKIPFYKRSR